MSMVTSVLGSGLIRKDLVVSHVISIDAIACRTTNNEVGRIAQVADEGSNSDIYYVISEPPAIRPATGNETTILEGILNLAFEHIAAKYAESGKPSIIGIRRVSGTVSSKPNA